jgi:hypothetical protein
MPSNTITTKKKGAKTLNITTLNIMTVRKVTHSIKGYVTLRIITFTKVTD